MLKSEEPAATYKSFPLGNNTQSLQGSPSRRLPLLHKEGKVLILRKILCHSISYFGVLATHGFPVLVSDNFDVLFGC